MLSRLTKRARYQTISFVLKAVTGACVIALAWFNAGLGFVGFGVFLYLHLLLHESQRQAGKMPQLGSILCPLDGTVCAVRHHEGYSEIDIQGDLLSSQMIFSPVAGKIDDRLWIDGVHLPVADQDAGVLNARLDFSISVITASDKQNAISLSLIAGPVTRYLYSPFVEGQVIDYAEPFGFALLRSVVTLRVPSTYQILVKSGESCLSRQTMIASCPS